MGKVESIKELRQICVKSAEKTKKRWTIQKRIMRFFSIYITKVLLYTNITANQVTWFMFFLGIFASLFFYTGEYIHAIIGSLLFHFWYVVDHVDGEIARYRRSTSHKGYFLDYMAQYTAHSFIFIFLTFGVYRQYTSDLTILAGFLIIFSLLMFYLVANSKYSFFFYIKEGRIKPEAAKPMRDITSAPVQPKKSVLKLFLSKLMGITQKIGGKLWFLFSFDKFIVLLLFVSLIDQLAILFFFYAVIYTLLIFSVIFYQYFKGFDAFLEEMKRKHL